MKKRILALLLSLCMIFSMVPVLGANAAGTEAEFTLGSTTAAYQQDSARYVITLGLSGITDVSSTTVPNGTPVPVTVDGETVTLYVYSKDASNITLYCPTTLGTHLVEIDAGTKVGSYTVKSDLKIKIVDYTATQLKIIRLGIDTTKGNQQGMTINNGLSRYEFHITGISGYSTWNEDQTILIDGTEFTGKGSTGMWYEGTPEVLYISYSVLGLGTNEGGSITKTFTIPKGTIFGNYITDSDLSFTINGWNNLTVHPTEVNIESVSGGYNNQYLFYLTTDLSFALPTSTYAVELLVDNQKTTVYWNHTINGIACDSAISKGEHTVVIPKGTKLGDCVTAADYTFYTHADGTVNTTPGVQTVSISSIGSSWNRGADWYITLNTDNSSFGMPAIAALSTASVTVDGEAASGWFQVTADGTLQFTLETDKADHTVVIPAGAKLGEYELKESYTFYTHADGTVDNTPQFSITGINSVTRRTDDYLVYLAVDNTALTLGSSTPAISDTVTVNGVAGNGWYYGPLSGNGTLCVQIVSEAANQKVVIAAGTTLGGFKLREEFVFYTTAEGGAQLTDPSKPTVNIDSVNAATSKHDGTSYHIYLNMSDSAFELDTAYNNTTIDVLVDGETKKVFLWNNGTGSLLVDGWDRISLGYHNVTVPAGTVIGNYALENAYTFRTYSNGTVGEADAGEIILNNATAMMGGSYGDGLYYDMSGSFTNGANWIVNATPTTGNITLQYVKNSESATGVSWYGPARTTHIAADWSVYDNGIVLNMGPNVFANSWGLTNVKWAYDAANYIAYFNNAGGVKVNADTYKASVVAPDGGYTDFAAADAGGAQYFGLAWNANGYTIDWTKLMIYDENGNDLGVTWYDGGADVTLTPMVEYGKTIYLKPADNNGLTVTGWKVIDLEGHEVPVTATQTNGVWSFVAPEDTASIEPVYGTVTVKITDAQGKELADSAIHWLQANTEAVEKQVQAAIAEDHILKGYLYDGELYKHLYDIPVGELKALTVVADTVQLYIEPQSDVRHGEDLADSGLRFVAILKAETYLSKKLQICDNATFANGVKEVGNNVVGFKEIHAANGEYYYSIALTDIPAEDYSKTYYARAGILVTYADGKQEWIYTEPVSATVNEAAENNSIYSDARTAYVDGVMNLDADAELVGNRSYTVSHTISGSYIITYTGGKAGVVQSLIIDGLRFTKADGVQFGENTVTVPGGLFANAKLKRELDTTGSMDIGAYFGPSVGWYQYTQSSGSVTDSSFKRTHDAVYADVEDYFGAGFNIWMAEDWVYGGTRYSENDALSALDLAAEYCINHGLTKNDIKVLVTDQFINGLLEGTDMNNGDRDAVARYAAIAEERINTLINYNPTVNGEQVGKEYNCFAGYLLRDEPQYKHMKYYPGWFSFLAAGENESATVTAWNTSGKEITGSVSCMGLLSKGYTLYFSLLGMSSAKNVVLENSNSTETCSEAEYVAYLNQFVNNVNPSVWDYSNMVLAFDNYGLYTEASGSSWTNNSYTEKRSENWQQNMSLFADLVQTKNPNARFAAALRSFGMTRKSQGNSWIKKTWKEYQAFSSTWGEQAISMQAYTALAHGYGYINWYTYWETHNQAYDGETYTDACVMWDENMNPIKQNMYYWVQSANAELRLIENLISNFTYKETAAIAASGNFYTGTGNVADTGMGGLWTATQLADNSALASISASVDTTAGYFTKGDGEFRDMFILVNMSHPENNASDTVTMTFDAGYTGVIVYLDGVASIYTLTNGSCSVTLPSGEGAIVIPVK